MATTFPTTLQDLDATRGISSQTLSNPNHVTHHTNEDDTIEALQAKVGVDSSAVTSTLDYKLKNASSIDPGHKHTSAAITDPGSFVPIGGIILSALASTPTNYLPCDGNPQSRTTYATLYAAIGTTFGVGDGVNTFNTPNMIGRVVLGKGTATKVATVSSRSSNTLTVTGMTNIADNEFQMGQAFVYHTTGTVMTGLTNDTTYYIIRVAYNQCQLASSAANAIAGTNIALSSDGTGTHTLTQTLLARAALGDTGGVETYGLSTTEIPSHAHGITVTTNTALDGSNISGAGHNANTATVTSQSAGSSGLHVNVQPYVVLNYIIRYT